MKFIPLIILLLLLQACFHRQGGLVTSLTNDTISSPVATIPMGGVIVPTYYHLKGAIDGKYPLTMDLELNIITNGYMHDQDCDVSGYYSLDTLKEPISFDLGRYRNDSLNIHSGFERFKGVFDGVTFSGQLYIEDICDPKDNFKKQILKQLSFKLSVDTIYSVPLEVFSYIDSVIVDVKLKNPPSAKYGCNLLFPIPQENQKFTKLLCYIYSETNSPSDVKKTIPDDAKNFLTKFKETAYQEQKYDSNLIDMHEWYRFYDAKVMFNSKNLTTLEYTNYGYVGGNHGYAHSKYYSYSVKDQRFIKLNDLLNQKDSVLLKTLILKYRRKAGFLNPSSQLISLNMFGPESFYVTPIGIAFLWDELHEAQFSPIPIFIPFSEFGNAIKKQSWME